MSASTTYESKIVNIQRILISVIFMGMLPLSSLNADEDQTIHMPLKDALTGFYAGVGIGYQNLSSKGKTFMMSQGPSTTDKMNLSGNNAVGEVHVGLGKLLNSFYYGGKLYANISSTKASQTKSTDKQFVIMDNKLQLSKNFGIGLVGHVGSKIGTNNVLYGILGISYGQFKINYTELDDNVSGKQTKKLLGLPLGIGFTKAVTESVRLFAEGTCTIYQSFLTSDLYTGGSDITFRTKIAPYEFNLIVGVSYAF